MERGRKQRSEDEVDTDRFIKGMEIYYIVIGKNEIPREGCRLIANILSGAFICANATNTRPS